MPPSSKTLIFSKFDNHPRRGRFHESLPATNLLVGSITSHQLWIIFWTITGKFLVSFTDLFPGLVLQALPLSGMPEANAQQQHFFLAFLNRNILHYVTAQLNHVGNRLNRYLLFKKISIDTLAREASISSTLIANMLNGGSYDFIFFLKVIHRLPDLNTHWVCTGQGDMLVAVTGEAPAPPAASQPEALPAPGRQEISLLRKQLEEKNRLIQRLKQTLAPIQHLLTDVE